MTTLLDHLDPRPTVSPASDPSITPSQRLRSTMAAARVSFTWFGRRRRP